MAAPVLLGTVSVEEYLRSSYDPDCDYVDGLLEERNFGQYDHGRIQTLVAIWFGGRERDWNVRVVVEQRVQVSATRIRVPDVCILRRNLHIEQIIRQAPLICIEVLSPDDSYYTLQEKVADYHRMGVEHVWLINPRLREGIVCTRSNWYKVENGNFVVPDTEIYVPLGDIFAGLDEA